MKLSKSCRCGGSIVKSDVCLSQLNLCANPPPSTHPVPSSGRGYLPVWQCWPAAKQHCRAPDTRWGLRKQPVGSQPVKSVLGKKERKQKGQNEVLKRLKLMGSCKDERKGWWVRTIRGKTDVEWQRGRGLRQAGTDLQINKSKDFFLRRRIRTKGKAIRWGQGATRRRTARCRAELRLLNY